MESFGKLETKNFAEVALAQEAEMFANCVDEPKKAVFGVMSRGAAQR